MKLFGYTKICSKCLLLVAFVFWFPTAYSRWAHPIHLQRCSLSWPYRAEWETSPLHEEAKRVLCESFSYLSRGAQAYVFLSQDEKYVLKLFRFDRSQGPHWVRSLRHWLGGRREHFLPLSLEVVKTLNSCKVAVEKTPDLTGIVYAHLNESPLEISRVQARDRMGRAFQFDPSHCRFVLQKKGEPFAKTLLQSEDPRPLVASLRSLMEEFSRRGIGNLDPTLAKNVGFLEGKAFQIDIGDLVEDPHIAKAHAANLEKRLSHWLQKHYPEGL